MNAIHALVFVCILANINAVAQTRFSTLVWSDEFQIDGRPDPSKWVYDIGRGNPEGWGNNELQFYTDEEKNVRIENGNLVVEAHRESRDGSLYTSARIKTKGKGDWLYGRFEVRARIPDGRGTWPAIWMLPTENKYGGWPLSGEIDIMEHVGYDPNVIHGTIHTDAYNHGKGTQKEGKVLIAVATKSFHIYAVEWDRVSMRFLVDDKLYHTVVKESDEDYTGWPFDHPFHMIFNIAVGGNWGGKNGVDDSIWPRRMEIDYIRVYQ